jgi:TolA-binding protein
MTVEAEHSGDEARWDRLIEAEAFGELSEAERRELEGLAEQDEERRQERQALASFATLTRLDPHLSAKDERLINTVLEQHAQHGGRRKATLWLAAAAVLIPLAAAAAHLPWREGVDESPNARAPITDPSVVPSGMTPSGRQTLPEVPEHVDQPEPAEASADPRGPPSAAELLARAQEARAARTYGKSVQAYRQLLRLYPASGEARLAQVSLAQLQLAQGNAAAALAGFDVYQRSGGALSQEAHYGKIQALRALGRTAEERVEMRRFLARYPKSLQGAALQRRLGAAGADE